MDTIILKTPQNLTPQTPLFPEIENAISDTQEAHKRAMEDSGIA